MLIINRLTKKFGKAESTYIIFTPEGKEIKVVLLDTTINSARIGIEADKDVRIVRCDAKQTT